MTTSHHMPAPCALRGGQRGHARSGIRYHERLILEDQFSLSLLRPSRKKSPSYIFLAAAWRSSSQPKAFIWLVPKCSKGSSPHPAVRSCRWAAAWWCHVFLLHSQRRNVWTAPSTIMPATRQRKWIAGRHSFSRAQSSCFGNLTREIHGAPLDGRSGRRFLISPHDNRGVLVNPAAMKRPSIL